jgi:NhaP-type Na+/H+ or K+/H+ antiporter
VHDIELFVFLLLAVAVLAGLGLRLEVPYPVALVLGGLVIGLMPGLPSPELDPDLVFFVFLPPLLYSAGVSASAYELRAEARAIGWLATGLVLVTIAAVAGVAHAAFGIPWQAAFVLGAVLGPTDPVSAGAVLNRLGVRGRVPTILEGESLINDGTGLTAYKIAIAWAGMRGGVSLAAALAIPVSVPERDLVAFLAYATIVITLVLPGLTLAPLIERLGLGEDAEHRRADAKARLRLTHAALERLEDAAERDDPPEHLVDRLLDLDESRLRARIRL